LKKSLILIFFLALLIGVGSFVYFGQHKERSAELYYSGTIEATQANLAFQLSGRVKEVLIDEGEKVEKDQILAVLDQEEFLARRNAARADLERFINTRKQMEALLDLNRAVIPAEVERAEAAVKALSAELGQLEAGYRVQEVEQARLNVLKAQTTMEEARRNKVRFNRLYREGIVAEKENDAVVLKYETALKDYEKARKAHELLKEGFRKEAIEIAGAKLQESRAALKEARSNLKKIEVVERELEASRALVQAAGSSLEVAEIQVGYTELKAPFNGIVVSRNIEPGEVVSPGREVLSVADLSRVELKIFVDETEIGKIKTGQGAEVRIDTFPGKTYSGSVSFISPEAEFTPKVIQTHKERVKLVYLVKITVPNPDLELKPGMPADAWLR
jgi:HlyD family secretion protein